MLYIVVLDCAIIYIYIFTRKLKFLEPKFDFAFIVSLAMLHAYVWLIYIQSVPQMLTDRQTQLRRLAADNFFFFCCCSPHAPK
jgi:hypothetical protein